MPIKYSCVNTGAELLAEFPVGDFPKYASTMQKVVASVPANEYRRKTIEDKDEGVNYHYLCNGEGRIVCCVATSDMRMRTVFAFLEALEPMVRVDAAELNGSKKLLQMKMDYYNDPKNDKITSLNDDINQVVDVMMDNMDKVLARGEKIDTLNSKSANLAEQAESFQHRSTELKRNMCMKNFKMILMVVGAILVTVFIIILIVCKPNFSNCK